MAALKHPLVEDRIIEGQGTSREQWLHAFEQQPLSLLKFKKFQSKRKNNIA